MKRLTGIAASPGIVYGKAFVYLEDGIPEIPRYSITPDQTKAEFGRLKTALEEAAAETRALREQMLAEQGREQTEILETHLLMLKDTEFVEQIRARLEKNLENIEWVVHEQCQELIRLLSASGDPYMRERSADITDVSRRILRALLSVRRAGLAELEEEVILVAHDILPSELLGVRRGMVKGIVMDAGGRTSHTAILAQAFSIPAVLGLSRATREIEPGDIVAVDGFSGEVMVNPAKPALARYRAVLASRRRDREELLVNRELPARTRDLHQVTLAANIEMPEEADEVLNFGAEGIGLYRSEFLFLTQGRPAGEETQYRAYSRVAEVMGNLPVTIRTVDVGGDKINPAFPGQGANEKNPLLGWRALRFCFALPEFFKTQLRAILRASAGGKVKIMFPMVSGIEELERAMELLEEAKAECRKKKQQFDETIEAGSMIEIPSAAMTADILAKKSAFFSIGTNDLIQYSLAVDRGNEKVHHLAQQNHPAVLRFLRMIIDAAHKQGIKAAMCGEMAGDARATPLLLGLGLDEFSMSAAAIPVIKRIIRGATLESCKSLAEKALACESVREVTALVDAWFASWQES